MIFLKVCINLAQCYKGVGGVGREEETPQVKTQGHKLPTDGPYDATRLKGHYSGQG